MIPTDGAVPGGRDAGTRALIRRIEKMEKELARLRAQTSAPGGEYTETDITIGAGGTLRGLDGTLDWSGPAIFRGLLSLTGTVEVPDNGISAAAVNSQATATSVSAWAAGWSVGADFSDLVTVAVPRPLWATRVVLFSTGTVRPMISGLAYSYINTRIVDDSGEGPESPSTFNQENLNAAGFAYSSPGKITTLSAPGATLTCKVQAKYTHSTNTTVPANAASFAAIGVVAVWSRG